MRYLAIALAGFLGANLRYAFTDLIGTPHGFPVATLLINLSGCGFLGWFYTVTVHKWTLHPTLRLGIGTGFVGAFTTFSTFTVELWQLVHGGLLNDAVIYAVVSLVGGLACTGLGAVIGGRPSRVFV